MAGMSPSLPPWAARLISEFDESDARARGVARGLTAEQLNWRPRPGAWSIGQCLAHLTMGNEVYLTAIDAALANRSPAGAVPEIILGAPSRWFISRYIAASPQMQSATAPRKIAPAPVISSDVVERFLRTNQMAREAIRRGAEHDVNRIRFRNPFVPVIRFTVGTGFEILSKHEQRHVLQAERVRQSPAFPAML